MYTDGSKIAKDDVIAQLCRIDRALQNTDFGVVGG